MTPTSIVTHVSEELQDTQKLLMPWFEQPEQILRFRPEAGGWTIAEILEHIVLTSKFLLILIQRLFRNLC